MKFTEKHRDSVLAFENAIDIGSLSATYGANNYAGNYMYMHSDENMDFFKNIQTRKYDVSAYIQPKYDCKVANA